MEDAVRAEIVKTDIFSWLFSNLGYDTTSNPDTLTDLLLLEIIPYSKGTTLKIIHPLRLSQKTSMMGF